MSGAKLLLDTNIVIGLLKDRPPAVLLVQASGFALAEAAVSQITRMELLSYPAMTAEEEQAIQTLLQAVTVIAIDHGVEKQAVALRRQHNVKLPDAIIAATAMVNNLQLITLDKALLQTVQKAQSTLAEN